MSVRSIFFAFSALTVGLLALFFAALLLYRQSEGDVQHAYNQRYDAYQLAGGFRQTSQDLTRLVRTYVSTGDISFKDQYFKVLDIQDGKIPTPVDYYTRPYWDFVAAGQASPRPDEAAVTLRERMTRAGIQGEEFKLLDEAISRSDALVALETRAMEMVEQPNISLEQRKAASDLLVSKEYHGFVGNILQPVDEFLVRLSERTNADVARANERLTLFATLMLVSAGALLLDLVVFGWLMMTRFVRGVGTLEGAMVDIAGGKLDREIPGTARRDEIGRMAKALEVFRLAGVNKLALEQEAEAVRMAQTASRERQAAIDSAKAEDLRVFVHHVEAAFDRLSGGDLTVRMTQAVAPEFEPIRAKFNTSVETLEGTIGSVVGAVGSMRVGLHQITVAAGDLSQRTEQQAASLEETVAALSEVTRGVNSTAESAATARERAQATQETAEKGGAIVARAVAAMAAIEASSDKIGTIIGVIDEIAFQTNLLALNAGVEAARAGEAGRGFAVVAQEVRGLAQRSAEAAKEIKNLISVSSSQVEQGVELVSTSGRSLSEIVTGVGDLVEVIAGIAHLAKEQAVSLREVSIAADQMDKVTQQNAAMVEETTAAAQSLSGETADLAALTDRFQTGADAHGAGSSARRAAPTTVRPSAGTSARSAGVAQMKHTGTGGAKPKAVPDEWEEF